MGTQNIEPALHEYQHQLRLRIVAASFFSRVTRRSQTWLDPNFRDIASFLPRCTKPILATSILTWLRDLSKVPVRSMGQRHNLMIQRCISLTSIFLFKLYWTPFLTIVGKGITRLALDPLDHSHVRLTHLFASYYQLLTYLFSRKIMGERALSE